MNTPIRMPFLERRRDNLHIQKSVQPNHSDVSGANAFLARSFVYLNAGALLPCGTGAILCYGYCVDPSHATTDQPPTALFGINHWPFDPKDCLFVMNITNATGVVGDLGPQLSTAVVGSKYALYREAAAVPTKGYQMLDTSVVATTTAFAKVVALYPGQALTDRNGLVIVELVPEVIQG